MNVGRLRSESYKSEKLWFKLDPNLNQMATVIGMPYGDKIDKTACNRMRFYPQ